MHTVGPLPIDLSLPALRTLGSVERFMWLLDRKYPVHFSMALQVRGETSSEQWRRALDQLQARHPLLSVRIRTDAAGTPEFHPVPGMRIPLRVTSGPLLTWVPEMQAEMGQRFNPEQAPLVRAVLVHQPEASVLILTLHHSIGDGMSGMYLFRDLLLSVAGQPKPPLPIPESMDTWASRAGVGNGCLPVTPAPTDAPSPNRIQVYTGANPHIEALQLSDGLSQSLRVRARREGTTVHGALVAALLLAGRVRNELWKDRSIRVMSPLNMRPYLGIGEDCGIFAGFILNRFGCSAGTSFWEIARSVRKQLKPELTREAIVGKLWSLAELIAEMDVEGAAAFTAEGIAHEANVTNIGEFPFDPHCANLHVEAIWGPSAQTGAEGEHVLSAGTVKGEGLCLLYISYAPMPRLLEGIQAVLEQAVTS